MSYIQVKDKELNDITATYDSNEFDLDENIIGGVYFNPEQYELTELVEDETEGEDQETEINENE